MQRWSKSSEIARVVIACVALAAAVASCGGGDDDDDDSSSAATTTTTASVCADRDALQTSVDNLKNVDLVAEGTNSAKSAITDVQDDLSELQTSASAELQPEVEAVQGDFEALKTAVEDLGSGGAAAAAAAVADFMSSAGALLDSLDNGPCGSTATT